MDKLKLIKFVVFVLTFLLVFGSFLVLAKLYRANTNLSSTLPSAVSLGEPEGSSIAKFKANGSQLHILVKDGGSSDRIIILDLNSGKKLSTIMLNQGF